MNVCLKVLAAKSGTQSADPPEYPTTNVQSAGREEAKLTSAGRDKTEIM